MCSVTDSVASRHRPWPTLRIVSIAPLLPRRFAGCWPVLAFSDLHHNVPDAFEPKLRNEQRARE